VGHPVLNCINEISKQFLKEIEVFAPLGSYAAFITDVSITTNE
jgi:hypothetical protein